MTTQGVEQKHDLSSQGSDDESWAEIEMRARDLHLQLAKYVDSDHNLIAPHNETYVQFTPHQLCSALLNVEQPADRYLSDSKREQALRDLPSKAIKKMKSTNK